MMKIREIRRGIQDDAKFKASLLKRLGSFNILGPHGQLDLGMFEHDSIQTLRQRVAAQEQLKAKEIMTALLQPGMSREQAFDRKLIKLAELAGEPMRRHFNALAAASKLNGGRATFQHDEVRSDTRDIIMAGLSSLAEKRLILTDTPLASADEKLRFAKKWWLISPMADIDYADASLGIAMIDHGRPIAGVVHFPGLNRTYAGLVSEEWAVASTGKRNPRKISTKTRENLKIVAATLHGKRKSSAFRTARNSHNVKRSFTDASPAYGLCRLAQGSMDIYLHPNPLPEASLAAAHAIVLAAGGTVKIQRTGQDIVYGNSQMSHLTAPGFVAASGDEVLKMRDVQKLVA